MNPFLLIAENRILEAMEKGEFDNLPGQGAPIDFTEDAHFSPEVRMAYRLFKSSQERQNAPPLVKQLQLSRDESNSTCYKTESLFAKSIQLREAKILALKKKTIPL